MQLTEKTDEKSEAFIAEEFLGEDAYEGVSAYIYPQITYRFDGKRFNRVK